MNSLMAQHVLMVTILIVSLISLAKLVKDNNIFTMIDESDDLEMEILKEEECKDIAA